MKRRPRPRAASAALNAALASIDAHVAKVHGQATVERLAAQRAQRAAREAAETAPRPMPVLNRHRLATEAELVARIAKAEHDGQPGVADRARRQLEAMRRG